MGVQLGSHPLTQVSGTKDWRVCVLIVVGVNAAAARQHHRLGLVPDTAACYLPLSTLPEPGGEAQLWQGGGGTGPESRPLPPDLHSTHAMGPSTHFWLISHENDP